LITVIHPQPLAAPLIAGCGAARGGEEGIGGRGERGERANCCNSLFSFIVSSLLALFVLLSAVRECARVQNESLSIRP